jgi:hypothetical protein
MTPTPSRAATAHFLAAALLLTCLLGALSACGSGDLVFPGDVPATPTSSNTATPTPDN